MPKGIFTHVISHSVMNTFNKQLHALFTSHSMSSP